MKIAIFGTGGVGGYFGARLAQAGEDVWFIARGAHLDAIRASGLHLESMLGDVHIQPARAEAEPGAVGPVDWVVCAVKAWQVRDAAEAMRPLVGAQTAVLPLQNGIEAAAEIARVVGSDRVVPGATWISAHVAGPGRIRHTAVEPRLAFGELSGATTARTLALRDALVRARVRVELSADVQAVIWRKFVLMSATSGLGAVTRSTIGAIREIPQTRALLEQAMAETARLAGAEKVDLPADVVAATMAYVDALPYDTMPSMQRDMVAGRPSELEAQSGAVVRLGRSLGIPTPAHEFFYAALLPLETAARTAGR